LREQWEQIGIAQTEDSVEFRSIYTKDKISQRFEYGGCDICACESRITTRVWLEQFN